MAVSPLDKLKTEIERNVNEYFKNTTHPRDCPCKYCVGVRAHSNAVIAWATGVAEALDEHDKREG